MKILHVVGARPNFMKVAPLIRAFQEEGVIVGQVLVHTGQHYDYNMSRIFFEELAMPNPDEFLGVGAGSHADQTARVMLAFEPVLLKHQPDWVCVVGDVNSTLACALVCAKLGVKVAHIEAGLRSGDRNMPEEINRILTDQISDLLFTPSRDGDENLLREGIPAAKIHFVGNVMIDTLVQLLPRAMSRPVLEQLNLISGDYLLVTLHRPSNVDHPETLRQILSALQEISYSKTIVFPVHPRTRKNITALGETFTSSRIHLLEPLGYLDFLCLEQNSGTVLTDSGGIQEETTFLGVPCLTIRANTERPVTITQGTNKLVESKKEMIVQAFNEINMKPFLEKQIPELWDGCTSLRIRDILMCQHL
jgi:UDP-N-acetylglucosamine 2-epimerase (non-hydrolysing)